MANKKTKRELFGEIREIVVGNEELVNFIDHELELLDKKHAKSGMTANQKVNAEIVDKLYSALVEAETALTINEIQEQFDFTKELSNQKISALLKKLVDTGKVERIKDKKVTRFQAIV